MQDKGPSMKKLHFNFVNIQIIEIENNHPYPEFQAMVDKTFKGKKEEYIEVKDFDQTLNALIEKYPSITVRNLFNYSVISPFEFIHIELPAFLALMYRKTLKPLQIIEKIYQLDIAEDGEGVMCGYDREDDIYDLEGYPTNYSFYKLFPFTTKYKLFYLLLLEDLLYEGFFYQDFYQRMLTVPLSALE